MKPALKLLGLLENVALSASVNLLILYRKEPVSVKRLTSQFRALRDLLKPSFFSA